MNLEERKAKNAKGRRSGYSGCSACGDTWDWKKSHTTKIDDVCGVFPLCEECWSAKSVEERMPFYHQLYHQYSPREESWAVWEYAVLREAGKAPPTVNIPYFVRIPPVMFEGTLNLKDNGKVVGPSDGFELCQMAAITLRDTGMVAKRGNVKIGGATGIAAVFGSAVEEAKLERQIAYDAAAADIESLCSPAGEEWYDTASIDCLAVTNQEGGEDPMLGVLADEEQLVARAVHYLDLLGLLEHRENEPTIVRIKPLPK